MFVSFWVDSFQHILVMFITIFLMLDNIYFNLVTSTIIPVLMD